MKLNRLIAITRKEIVQIRRDPRSLMIVFLMPVMLMALLGYGISLDQKNVPTCVFDREGSQQSQDLLKQFQASPYFRIAMVNNDYASLVQAINDGKCSLGVVIPIDFAEQLEKGGTVDVQGVVDAVNDNTANLIFGYAEAVLAKYSANVQLQYFQSNGYNTVNPPLSVESRAWFNERSRQQQLYRAGRGGAGNGGHRHVFDLAHRRARVGARDHGAAYFHASHAAGSHYR